MTELTDPLPLACGQILPNRLMKSALSEGLADRSSAPDERLGRLYRRWGSGGYGLVVTGNVMVDRGHLGEVGNVVVEDDRDLDALTLWAKATQDGGAPIWMQLNHPGRQANPLVTGKHPVAPSPVGLSVPGLAVPRELTEAEILDIVDRFATAARVAETAGFDGVQIHGAHGYLVSQFLSPRTNQRTDGWGGDPERRMRFLLEVIHRIRISVSPGFAVGVKLNSADFQRGGFTEEESRAVVERLATQQIDLIEISGGSYESPAMMGRPTASERTRTREAYFLDYAQAVRATAGHVPLAVTGGFRSAPAMREAVGSGACDVVGIGRPAAVVPGAAADLLAARAERLDSPQISLNLPRRAARIAAVKALDGALDLQWHTDQLQRMGAGSEPDPSRSPWLTAASTVRHHGVDAFRNPKRGIDTAAAGGRGLRKFRFERAVGRYLANPAVRALGRAGVRTSIATELETTGRRTGEARRVPVAASFDPTGAWLICQHGMRSGWGLNIAADPVVRIRQGDRWRRGLARLHPDDDVTARARTFAPVPFLGCLSVAAFRTLQSTPISVRVTFTDEE
ncbi:nitroreductase/quinone reductase family protein [Tsukamurella soli]|uniref:NADH:flavin oxidoreductase/NADH oxidase N-terminal domain-containing protein n=1 Tax=Tsukamurella soli TaxID=644556 RepID=A0ABP8JV31_9ACTN